MDPARTISHWTRSVALIAALAAPFSHAVTEGEAAPDFTLPALAGDKLRLEGTGARLCSDFLGELVRPCRPIRFISATRDWGSRAQGQCRGRAKQGPAGC